MGPRKDGPEKSMAVDFVRHGIELCRLSESELAARFNAELSRAVRYEPKRSQAAEQLISMHKRHGEVVNRVLREKIAEQAEKLVIGAMDASSLLALVLGKKHLEYQGQAADATEQEHKRAAKGQDGTAADSLFSLQNPVAMKLAAAADLILAKFGTPAQRRGQKRGKLGRRDTVIFAAILLKLEGIKYCTFLRDHGLSPKWSDSGPASYPKSYQTGNSWRKKVQDEKTRARARMDRCTDPEIANALNIHLPDQFQSISQLIPTRATRTTRVKLPVA